MCVDLAFHEREHSRESPLSIISSVHSHIFVCIHLHNNPCITYTTSGVDRQDSLSLILTIKVFTGSGAICVLSV